MTQELHVGDSGTTLRVTVEEDGAAVDVSGATAAIILKDPSGNTAATAASFTDDGSDGQIEMVTTTETLTEAGKWWIQAKITTDNGEWYSDTEEFYVAAIL